MKKINIILAVIMVAVLSVSCKNSQKNADDLIVEQAVESAKTVLGDDVLAIIDDIADEFISLAGTGKPIELFTLSEQEKMVKPDYLLDPDKANYMLSKAQKTNTLACLFVERHIREAYDMPLNECDEAIAKLVTDINHPLGLNDIKNKKLPDILKEEYEICKNRNELFYYWQFQFSTLFSIAYVLSQDPEFYLSKITEEQWNSFYQRSRRCYKAVENLAAYDPETAKIQSFIIETGIYDTDRELRSLETAKAFFVRNKTKFAAAREKTFE